MRRLSCVCAALLIAAAASAQPARPMGGSAGRVPPEPRDGRGSSPVTVPILIYHAIRPYTSRDTPAARRYIATPATLDNELAYLRDNGFTSASFDDLARALSLGDELPGKPVILSFDDCWENQYTNALPLLEKYGFTATFYAWVSVVGRRNHLTWDQLREMADAGMQIGCHTMTHPRLTQVRDDAELRRQIADAKHIIEVRVGRLVRTLAYPFGQYNERVAACAREAGFTSARSTWPGVVHDRAGLLSLTGLIRTESAVALERDLVADLQTAEREAALRADAELGLAEEEEMSP